MHMCVCADVYVGCVCICTIYKRYCVFLAVVLRLTFTNYSSVDVAAAA